MKVTWTCIVGGLVVAASGCSKTGATAEPRATERREAVRERPTPEMVRESWAAFVKQAGSAEAVERAKKTHNARDRWRLDTVRITADEVRLVDFAGRWAEAWIEVSEAGETWLDMPPAEFFKRHYRIRFGLFGDARPYHWNVVEVSYTYSGPNGEGVRQDLTYEPPHLNTLFFPPIDEVWITQEQFEAQKRQKAPSR